MVKKLGYLVLGASDLDAMVEHYTGSLSLHVTERDDGAVWLAAGDGVPCLGVERGSQGLLRTGLEIAMSLDQAQAELEAAGIATTRCSESAPGVASALVVQGLDGVPLHLHEARPGGGVPAADRRAPQRLGHVATFVEDLDATSTFVEGALGFRWADSVAFAGTKFFTFMRCGPDHHTMNFMENPDERGLHHFAFEAQDIEHLKSVCDQFARTGITLAWGVGRHGPGHNLFTYHCDPEGNLVEVFAELDVMLDESSGSYDPRPWHEDSPQRPKVWDFSPVVGNSWGPGPTDPEFLKTPAWIGEAIAAAQA